MRRKIPSTAALAAFEAAARHQSFTLAADELAVTQSAVCRQIAVLEDFVGLKLFRRSRRGVVLTAAGAQYSRSVRVRLDEVERDTLDLMAKGGAGGALELGVVPTFATRWLLPRLGGFQRAHPGITVHLSARARPFLFDDAGLDAAIHAGDGKWPGTQSRLLLREQLVAVGSPALLGARKRLKAADVARLPLIQQGTRPYAWRQWFASLGLSVEHDMAGPRMELFSMATEAAIHGLGAALVPRFLVEEELASGRLLALVDHAFTSDRSYHLIYPEHKADDPVLGVFREWIEGEAASDRFS
ncbi:LysR family transcriptional regulator [Piscinibacter sp.]|uniref:LysR family transcriptional regulator n=1 Tax=Piscinibacter sp. TaxID=1903157 RepID=UPI002C88D95E|nr:LysR family transcriptional regulator [Albitalea sp.]HUG22361.1 LysR family transcriptional regulator [Albitalea sp.]